MSDKSLVNIKGSNQLYLAVSPELLSDYSFLLGESQGHQMVLKMCPVVFYIYIKTVAHAFFFLTTCFTVLALLAPLTFLLLSRF